MTDNVRRGLRTSDYDFELPRPLQPEDLEKIEADDAPFRPRSRTIDHLWLQLAHGQIIEKKKRSCALN